MDFTFLRVGVKEIYTQVNAEFQRIARREKKAFLSDQCKYIVENNRMGKTRDVFKKIRDTKGTFPTKIPAFLAHLRRRPVSRGHLK